jgi:hypothetical protein
MAKVNSEAIKAMFMDGMGVMEIARTLNLAHSTVQHHTQGLKRPLVGDEYMQQQIVPNNTPSQPWFHKFGVQGDDGKKLTLRRLPERVLCFSCSQAPFQHKSTIPFLAMVLVDTKPDLVIMMGDLVDFKFMKKAFTGPDDRSPTQELKEAQEFVAQLTRIMPQAIMLTSNHGEGRVFQMQQSGNVPSVFLRRWQEVLGLPDGWVTRDYVIAGNTLFEHGHGVSKGSRPSLREEMVRRFGRSLSAIRGHRHNLFGEQMVPFWESQTRQVRLAYVGCTMDDGQQDYTRSGLWNGCLLINRGAIETIPMERDAKGDWTGRLVPWDE